MVRVGPEHSRWLLELSESPNASMDLFCLPYAGAGGAVFQPWSRQLERRLALWAVEYPGRGSRLFESPVTRLAPLVEDVAAALAPRLDRPFVLFGHSLGALVAFELSRQLAARHGLEPECLVVSGYAAPQIPTERRLHALPDAELLRWLQRVNGVSGALPDDPRLMRLLLPAFRADFEICETYTHVPGPLLRCPIIALGGVDDGEVPEAALCHWRALTRGAFTAHLFPGDHFFLHAARASILALVAERVGPGGEGEAAR